MPTFDSEIKHAIQLSFTKNIGHNIAKTLLAYCGSFEAIYQEKSQHLLKIPNIGESIVKSLQSFKDYERVEKEMSWIEKNNISPIIYSDRAYSEKLKNAYSSPIILYTKGDFNLNSGIYISIVGTRKVTDYGKSVCSQLISDLKIYNPTIVSGLAYGVDIIAHREAIQHNLPTVSVFAHGLDRVYPNTHKNTAHKMLQNGGWITEYPSNTNPDREKFPARNRIVAGLSDITIVIESAKKGGSLITAQFANEYNRDVFALPGNVEAEFSKGCNHLIKTHKAHLFENAEDIAYIMGWEKEKKEKEVIQTKIFPDISIDEQLIVNYLGKNKGASIDDISLNTNFSPSKTSSLIFNLEINGIIKMLPGKKYKML